MINLIRNDPDYNIFLQDIISNEELMKSILNYDKNKLKN